MINVWRWSSICNWLTAHSHLSARAHKKWAGPSPFLRLELSALRRHECQVSCNGRYIHFSLADIYLGSRIFYSDLPRLYIGKPVLEIRDNRKQEKHDMCKHAVSQPDVASVHRRDVSLSRNEISKENAVVARFTANPAAASLSACANRRGRRVGLMTTPFT